MRIAVALLALVFVLGLGSAVGQARKGRWWKAAEVFLPVLGVDLMLLDMEWHSTPLFWLGSLLVVAGFGAEGVSYWKTRTQGRAAKSQSSGG
jgi:hypothetical protein